jgi:hypothetical protein
MILNRFMGSCLAVLFLCACSLQKTEPTRLTPTVTPDPISEEDQVYAALVAAKFPGGMLVIMDHTQTDISGLASPETYQYTKDSLSNLSEETFADFKVRNDASYPLRANMQLGGSYLLFSEQDRQELFKINQSGWDVFYNRYPDAPGILTLSRVGFNSTQDQALVYMGIMSHWLAGSGNYILLKKVDGAWVIDQQVMSWVS